MVFSIHRNGKLRNEQIIIFLRQKKAGNHPMFYPFITHVQGEGRRGGLCCLCEWWII